MIFNVLNNFLQNTFYCADTARRPVAIFALSKGNEQLPGSEISLEMETVAQW